VVDIRGVADYVNKRKRAAENRLQVARCLEQISGMPFPLVTPSRRYITEGYLYDATSEKARAKQRYVFAFNDLFLVTTPKGASGSSTGSIRSYGGSIKFDGMEKERKEEEQLFAFKYSVDMQNLELSEYMCGVMSGDRSLKSPSEIKRRLKIPIDFGFALKKIPRLFLSFFYVFFFPSCFSLILFFLIYSFQHHLINSHTYFLLPI
jgi:hypothetical protein